MRLFDVDWPPGWRETTYCQLPAAMLTVEAGTFFAARSVDPRDGTMFVRFQPSTEPFAGQSWGVAICPANEVVGQCLLFDTGRYL